jgi:VIT1/CCC1 family predicted Fe2+/Mn2+ transporter
MPHLHRETHLIERIGWLRAAVLGANDGIISTASLMLGVAAASNSTTEVLVAGIAGLVAGAMSMAAGEFVSVSSQSDTENADMAREQVELVEQPEAELNELAAIYEGRGLDKALAHQVAIRMTAHNAFEAHTRDELGLAEHVVARPVQAAVTSALTFSVGAAIPLGIALASPRSAIITVVSAGSIACLAALGALGARLGGAPVLRPTARVAFWGAIAMAATALIGLLVGRSI